MICVVVCNALLFDKRPVILEILVKLNLEVKQFLRLGQNKYETCDSILYKTKTI